MGFGIGGYYLIGIVTFFVSLAVSGWLRATYGRWAKVANASGLTGREVAEGGGDGAIRHYDSLSTRTPPCTVLHRQVQPACARL